MKYIDQIQRLQSRAAAINLNICSICRMTPGASYTLFSGWKSGRTKSPTIDKFLQQTKFVDDALTAEERRLGLYLLQLHPDLADIAGPPRNRPVIASRLSASTEAASTPVPQAGNGGVTA